MRGSGLHPFPHRRLNIREPVEVRGRTVCCEGAGCEASWFSLPEVVVGLGYQRGHIRRSVGIVGRLCLTAPLTEPGEQLLLGCRFYPVTRGIGAIASEHDGNTRLAVCLVGGLRRLRDQLAVKDRSRLVRRSAGRAVKHLIGAESAQTGKCGLIDALDSH